MDTANISQLFCGRGRGEVSRIETCSHVKLRQIDAGRVELKTGRDCVLGGKLVVEFSRGRAFFLRT